VRGKIFEKLFNYPFTNQQSCGIIKHKLKKEAKEMEKKPETGMGATIAHYSDREAYTIIEVSPLGKVIKIQKDKATRTDSNGMSDCQYYDYTRDPNGITDVAKLRKNGLWKTMDDLRVLIDCRNEYFDYSF
jgi:hypothetical protein